MDAFPPLAEEPGLKVGAGRLTHFQAGYLGGRSDADHREAIEIRDLGFGEQAPWVLAPEASHTTAKREGPKDIETLTEHIVRAAALAGTRPPRPPWVDQLPTTLPFGEFLAAHPGTAPSGFGLTIGLRDEPHLQRQTPYRVPLDAVGNLAVFGGAGSGKTTTLIISVFAAIREAPDTQVYGIDAASGRLQILESLPNTGDIVEAASRDRVLRLLWLVRTIVAERTSGAATGPPVLLLIDGFAAFKDAYDQVHGRNDPFGDLVDIAQRGRTVGVHLLLTSERSAGMSMSLASTISERLVLRLPAESDYNSLGVPKGVLEESLPGRVLRIGSDEEIQLAMPGPGCEPADTDAVIRELAASQEAAGIKRPTRVPPLPAEVFSSELPPLPDGDAAFAIDTVRLAPIAAPREGLLLVCGPAGSGRSTAILSLLAAFTSQQEEPLDAVLISARKTELRDAFPWTEIAQTTSERDRTIARLTRALGSQDAKRLNVATVPTIGTKAQHQPEAPKQTEQPAAPDPPSVFPAPGTRGVVVVEDLASFDGSGNEHALTHLLKILRRSDLTTVVEGENATLTSGWELAIPLRGVRWALLLQPESNDIPSVITTKLEPFDRKDFPPGRGVLVHNGRSEGVHVGLP